jgi:hypothetical protein
MKAGLYGEFEENNGRLLQFFHKQVKRTNEEL